MNHNQYNVRVQQAHETIQEWTSFEAPPQLVGDVIVDDGSRVRIVERVWDGPRKLTLRVSAA